MSTASLLIALGAFILAACSSSSGASGDDAGGSGGVPGHAGGGRSGVLQASGGAPGASGTAGGASGGATGGSRGGATSTSSGGSGGLTGCCSAGCDEPCTPGTSRSCTSTSFANWVQDCRCDGSGWSPVRSVTAAGGACSLLDGGREPPDAAASGAAPSDAGVSDGGRYCIFETSGYAGAPPATYCVPFPPNCGSCACLSLPYSYCTCIDYQGGGVSVRCLGV